MTSHLDEEQRMKSIRLIGMSVILGAAMICGCSQSNTKTANDAIDGTITVWQENTPNPLLAYVPEDAAIVLATQRKRDINSTGMNEFLDLLQKYFRHELSDDLKQLFSAYAANATKFGLDPSGRTDVAMYLQGNKLVMHITAMDEKIMLDYFNKLFTNELNDRWQFKNEQNWNIYEYNDEDQLSIAAHAQNNVFTFVISNSKGKAYPELMSAQKRSFVPKDTLGDTFLYGYINYERLIDSLLKTPIFVKEIDGEYFWSLPSVERDGDVSHNEYTKWLKAHDYTSAGDEVCINDFKSYLSDLTSSDILLTLSDSGVVGIQSSTTVSSALAGDLKNVMTEHVVLDAPNAKLNGHLSISVDNAINVLQKYFLSRRNWKCHQINGFIHAFDLDEINEITDSNYYKEYIKGFKSVSFLVQVVIDLRKLERDFVIPQFVVHMNHSQSAIQAITKEVDIEYKEGSVIPYPMEENSINLMLSGNDAYVSSDAAALSKQYPKKVLHYADIIVTKDFIYTLVKDEISLPLIFLSGYHLNYTLNNNKVVFSILPLEN